VTSHNLQTKDFGDEGKLVMTLHSNAHFAGYEPGDVIEISYLTPAGEENHWHCNNGEFHRPDDVRSALEAFDERAAAGGWKASSKALTLDDILESERQPVRAIR
jgi:hypothetical protein